MSVQHPLSRRRLLHIFWSLPVIAALCQLCKLLTSFTLAGQNSSRPPIIELDPVAELPEKNGAPLYHRRGKFWLLNNDDGIVAITNTCSHLECLFTWDREGNGFICPCHGSRFDRHGRVLNGPATRDLHRYPLNIVDGEGTILASAESPENCLQLPEVPEKSGEDIRKPQLRLQVLTESPRSNPAA